MYLLLQKASVVDGHTFIDTVFEKGALGVICEKAPENPKGSYILVEDSFQALKDVAALLQETAQYQGSGNYRKCG